MWVIRVFVSETMVRGRPMVLIYIWFVDHMWRFSFSLYGKVTRVFVFAVEHVVCVCACLYMN